MSSLVGARVVRGPDWKWGDQDGGEGHTGTVIPTSDLDLDLFGPRTITVLWDSGLKFTYQGGPEESYDLRIINNAALGVRHSNIPCDNESCWVQEIRGMRWQCVVCNINLCTSCFLHEIPHRNDHDMYRRFENDLVLEPQIVCGWYDKEPEIRIKLLGSYPGAKVSLNPVWPYGREDEKNSGWVISAPREEASGRILIEWLLTKERTLNKRYNGDEDCVLRVIYPGIGGFYTPCAFPVADSPPVINHGNHPELPEKQPAFSIGDRVNIDATIKKEEWESKQKEVGGYAHSIKKFIGVVGTVHTICGSSIYVRFKTDKEEFCFRVNPTVLGKLNQFSINQTIWIRSDDTTIKQMENRIDVPDVRKKLIGAIGRISFVSEENPDELYVNFQNIGFSSKIFFGASPLPSAWMEYYEMPKTQPAVKDDMVECTAKIRSLITLFFNAVYKGDLKIVQKLHKHLRMDLDNFSSDEGMTALQIACDRGHENVAEWLIYEAKADLNASDMINDSRAIHYAVKGCWIEILIMLIEKGADLDVRTDSGTTALHMAVSNQFTECSRLLIHAGCGLNFKDSDGNTPLHIAILNGSSLCVQQILPSLFINLKIRNKMGFNALQLAVILDDFKTIELITDKLHDNSSLLEFMPESQSTVLHYVCIHGNYQVAKLLVEKSKNLDADSGLLTSLLEVKNESGKTALLISCQNKDCGLIELLIAAGAVLNAVDSDGNTAIVLTASSDASDEIPCRILSPSILKAFHSVWNDNSTREYLLSSSFVVEMTETYPTLLLMAYLMAKGCSLDATDVNNLYKNGFPEDITEILNRMVVEILKMPSGTMNHCIVRRVCMRPPVFQFSCPHKPTYKACSKCILSVPDEAKCGCTDQEVSSIPIVPTEYPSEINGCQLKPVEN